MSQEADQADSTPAWQREPRALWRRSGDTTIVLTPGRVDPIHLVGAGGAIWEALGQAIPEEELVSVLAKETGADMATIRADVRAFVRELADAGAILVAPSADVGG